MQSVDRAVLESAALPLPQFGSGSVYTPRTAPRGDVRPPAAMAPGTGVPKQIVPPTGMAGMRPTTTDTPERESSPSFFSRLKPTWLFGKSEEPKPSTDPFADAAQRARVVQVGAQGGAPGAQRIATHASTSQATVPADFQKPSKRTNPMGQRSGSGVQPAPTRGGLVTRSDTGKRRGLFSSLWGGGSDNTGGAPADSTPGRLMAQKQAGGSTLPSTRSMPAAPPATRPVWASGGANPAAMAATMPAPTRRTAPLPTPLSGSGYVIAKDGGVTKDGAPVSMEGAYVISDETPAEPAKRPMTVVASDEVPPVPTAPESSAPKQATETAKLAVDDTTKPAPAGPESAMPIVVTPMATEPAAQVAKAPAPVVTKPTAPAKEATKPAVVLNHPTPTPRAPYPQAGKPVSEGAATMGDAFVWADDSQPKPTPTNAEPSDRGRALLAEAHQLAATAASAAEYSAVLKRCRYVLAIDGSTVAREYANQLAGWALTKRGESFEEAGRIEEARADFQDALRCDPECWRAEHALGVMAARDGDSDLALRRFNRTLEFNPEFAKAYANRAALAVQRGDYEIALQDYQQAIDIDPDFEVAHTGRGRVCHILGLLDEGLRHLDAAEILSPEDAMISTGRADLLVDLGRYGQAIEAYERAISLDPEAPAAYRNLAWLRATCPVESFRDSRSALENAEQAERLAGGADDLTLDTKAAALAAAGRFDEASEVQLKAIESAPETDANAYRERLAMYQQGEAFTSQPVGVRQAAYTK